MELVIRQYLPSFAELMDLLTIDRIKSMKLPEIRDEISQEESILCHDIDLIIEDRGISFTSRMSRIIITLSQVNLEIWELKDKMTEVLEHNELEYLKLLKKAHQLNGVRNQIKNLLMEETGDKCVSGRKTNFNTDGLQGWELDL